MRRALVLIAVAAAGLAGCDPVPPTHPDLNLSRPPDSLIEYYDEVVFGIGSPEVTEPLHRMWRWGSAEVISVRLIGGVDGDRAEAERVLDELSDLTGLTFRWDAAEPDSLRVVVLPRAEWDITVHDTIWGTVRWSYSGYRITGAYAYIEAEMTTQRRHHVIREEITQALGLFWDSLDYDDSIFYNAYNPVTEFSEADVFVIESHYDDRLRPGMTRDSVHAALGWD